MPFLILVMKLSESSSVFAFGAIKIFIDLIAGAQSENFLRILRREIPQRIILRREKWKRCERDVNHKRAK